MKTRILVVASVISLLAGSTGCSWLFMSRLDRDHERSQKPDCSDWYIWPGLDALNSASVLATGVGMSSGGFSGGSGDVSVAAWAAWLVPAMVYFHSAIGGFFWARECNEAIDEHERWEEEQAGKPLP